MGTATQVLHEALNFAAVNHLGVVFICENNLWALSTPFQETTAGEALPIAPRRMACPASAWMETDVELVFNTASAAAARSWKAADRL